MPSESDPAAACPVDHKAREAWLKQAKSQNANNSSTAPSPAHPSSHPSPVYPLAQSEGCDSSQIDQEPSSNVPLSTPSASSILSSLRLGTAREVSSIPRATPPPAAAAAATDSDTPAQSNKSRPANSEAETGADKKTGNWIYPSEEMFFNAMKRKSYDAQAADMRTIVPIHNAVNERAWKEIKGWEKGRGGESCGGPRLASFSGLSSSLTPRARFNTLLGYQAPFDRHDWVVDRCGQKIEYVIDFYAGKDEKKEGKGLNFYLDVRPKLNSWEGVKMRALRFVGM